MSRLLMSVVLCALSPVVAISATIRVPSEVGTIQGAIGLAASGDIVLVEPGTYHERLNIISKNITLRGEFGAEVTTVLGDTGPGNVITIQGVSRDMIVEGLTVTGGTFNPMSPDSGGAAIYVDAGRPTIRSCRLTNNAGIRAGGVEAISFSSPLIQDCWIAYNDGGGVWIETGDGQLEGPRAELVGNFIVRNTGFGVSTLKGARTDIVLCTIAFNLGDGVRGQQDSPHIKVHNSLVTDNQGAGIVRYDNTVCFNLQCNDVYNNSNGQWLGANPGDPCFTGRGAGSVSIAPGYHDPLVDDFTLSEQSVLRQLCVPGSCGTMGADPICEFPVSVRVESWTAVKAHFRE